jgi:catechol 2,3-dioxygenase-like lactoylglutathione lyase family enzyme
MSTQAVPASSSTGVASVDMKFELAVIPVSDVDRAKEFYRKLQWRLDADFDIQAARAELAGRGVPISEVFHDGAGVYAGTDEPYLFGRFRASGPESQHRSYRSFASFHDPDGNGWLLQEITARLPGRIDSATTSFASARDLASALRRAASAHGQHEQRIGQADPNWPDWYAEFMVREQNGEEPPQ